VASEARIAANRRNARKEHRATLCFRQEAREQKCPTARVDQADVGRRVRARGRGARPSDRARPRHRFEMVSARQVAEAQLELERIQRVKNALIERIAALGRLYPRNPFRTIRDETAWAAQHFLGVTLGNIRPKCTLDACRPPRRRSGAPCPSCCVFIAKNVARSPAGIVRSADSFTQNE
jgi:hypothetical protein